MARARHSGAVDLLAELDAFVPRGEVEAADLARVRHLARSADPAGRATPVHLTASALVVHPPTGRVLLRWHERMGSWLHVGGHIDPGESHPLVAALREGAEETGLPDLVPWPRADRPQLLQVVVVPVPAGKGEPAHEHADLRYVLATGRPEKLVPESPSARPPVGGRGRGAGRRGRGQPARGAGPRPGSAAAGHLRGPVSPSGGG